MQFTLEVISVYHSLLSSPPIDPWIMTLPMSLQPTTSSRLVIHKDTKSGTNATPHPNVSSHYLSHPTATCLFDT